MTDVSVVVPVHNHADLLPRAVRALSAQDNVLEIILVNDGSTDHFHQVAGQLCREFSFIELIDLSARIGPIGALNKGILHASGHYVYLGAADDEILPHAFHNMLALMRSHPTAPQKIVSAEVLLITAGSKRGSYRPLIRPRNSAGYISPPDLRRQLRESDNWILTGAALVERATLLNNGCLNENLGAFADSYAYRRIAFQWGLHFFPGPVARWNISGTGVSQSLARDWNQSRYILELALKLMERHPEFPDWYRRVFERRWWFSQLRISSGRNNDGEFEEDAIYDILHVPRSIIGAIAQMPKPLSRFLLVLTAAVRLKPFRLRAAVRTWFTRTRQDSPFQ